jgi:nitrogen fixation/metabolism regulation signal transduction histidine kinase
MSQDAIELLLSGVKDQAQRKQITRAYYAFANGDPETFAVQFAVLLRAHATSLKLLPARLEKVLSAETRKLGDLVIAHQNSVQRMASLLDQESRKNGVGEGSDVYLKIQQAIENQLAAQAEVLRTERERIGSTVATNGRLLQKLAAQRMILGLIVSFIAGALSLLFFQQVLPLLLRSLV